MPKTPKRRNYTIAVKDLLPSLGQQIGFANNRRNIALNLNWQKIVGVEYAGQLRPAGIKNNGHKKTLTVHCQQGAALQLAYAQEEICERVNRYFGKEIINRLHLIPQSPGNKRQSAVWGEKTDENRHQPTVSEEKSSLYRSLQKLSEKI